MLRFLPFILWFALALYAVIDCVRTPTHQMPGRLAKPLWLLLIVLVPVGLGAVAWIIVAGAQRAEDRQQFPAERRSTTPRPAPRRRPSRAVAPDDDPDFLAQLEQQARARRREERRREREEGGRRTVQDHREDQDLDEELGPDAERDTGSEA